MFYPLNGIFIMDAFLNGLKNRLVAATPEMVERLTHWCNMNTGSDNLQGLQHFHLRLESAFAPLADTIESLALPEISTLSLSGQTYNRRFGDALLIRKRPHLKSRILLCGHMDTVFSPTHPFQTVKQIEANVLNGPGVADMKGGLLVMLEALRAFEESPMAENIGWDVLINSDEELGSPASAATLDALAPLCQAALVYEPAMTPEGTLAKNRRGSGKFSLIARGRAAHVGRAFNEGRNAIWHLARAVCALHALNGRREGVTVNIGKIGGGEALNMVPDTAVAQIDVRIQSSEDEAWVVAQFSEILENLAALDFTLNLHGGFGRPVKRVNRATEALFARVQALGKQLGLSIDWKDSGGCCDGNNLARHGLPVLDTLGVRGGNIHTADEFLLIDSLAERILLSTLLLMELADGALQELTA